MLFINFIGNEPKSLWKVLFVDFITIVLQALILQYRWDPAAFPLLSALPVPMSDPLVRISEDPNLSRSLERTVTRRQASGNTHRSAAGVGGDDDAVSRGDARSGNTEQAAGAS